MQQKDKNTRKQTIKDTKKRRTNLSCKTYSCKIIKNKLNKKTEEHLYKLFLEAKWLYNYILSKKDKELYNYNTKLDTILVMNKDYVLEERKLEYLSSQMKQEIHKRLKNNISALSALKKKGFKVGKLKFKSKIDSIPLKQYNITFTILDKNYIKIQGLKTPIKVKGLNQIPKDSEMSNATLTRTGKDFFFNITCYIPKIQKNICEFENAGIDLGIETQATLYDEDNKQGIKIKYEVPIDKRIRRLDRKISRSKSKNNKKTTKNCYKLKLKRQKAYEHNTNQKKDIVNKIVNVIATSYTNISCQDESLANWKKFNFGKKLQNTNLKGIIVGLQSKSNTFTLVDKFFPSTKTCCFCGKKQEMPLSERIHDCIHCKNKIDRDIGSSVMMNIEGKRIRKELSKDKEDIDNLIGKELSKSVPTEYRDHNNIIINDNIIKKPLERNTSVLIRLKKIQGINISVSSMKEEAAEFIQQ